MFIIDLAEEQLESSLAQPKGYDVGRFSMVYDWNTMLTLLLSEQQNFRERQRRWRWSWHLLTTLTMVIVVVLVLWPLLLLLLLLVVGVTKLTVKDCLARELTRNTTINGSSTSSPSFVSLVVVMVVFDSGS